MTNAHEEGRVYAIDDGQGCVKIGWAKDPVRRLREMNVSDAGRLTLIGSARGTRAHEAEAHALLKPWRARGEWFHKAGHVLTFLDMLPKYTPESKGLFWEPADFDEEGNGFQTVCARQNGLRRDIARVLNLTHSAVYQWLRVPSDRVVDIERLTGIPREVLRPDIFSKANTVAAKRNATSAS